MRGWTPCCECCHWHQTQEDLSLTLHGKKLKGLKKKNLSTASLCIFFPHLRQRVGQQWVRQMSCPSLALWLPARVIFLLWLPSGWQAFQEDILLGLSFQPGAGVQPTQHCPLGGTAAPARGPEQPQFYGPGQFPPLTVVAVITLSPSWIL